MLLWHKRLWLIDHGATLSFHYTWADYLARAGDLEAVDAELAGRLDGDRLRTILALVPDERLGDAPGLPEPAAHRAAYASYLTARLEAPRPFMKDLADARAQRV